MKRSFLAMLLLSQLGQTALAEPPEWASDATETVQKKKIMRGIPHDPNPSGERAVKRNDLVEIFERLDLERQKDFDGFATKEELHFTRDDAQELRSEMEVLNSRVENLEQTTDVLEQRDEQVARPRF